MPLKVQDYQIGQDEGNDIGQEAGGGDYLRRLQISTNMILSLPQC